MSFNKSLQDSLTSAIFDYLDPVDIVVEWVQKHLNPDDVFDENQLAEWAEENGFVKEEEEG